MDGSNSNNVWNIRLAVVLPFDWENLTTPCEKGYYAMIRLNLYSNSSRDFWKCPRDILIIFISFSVQ